MEMLRILIGIITAIPVCLYLLAIAPGGVHAGSSTTAPVPGSPSVFIEKLKPKIDEIVMPLLLAERSAGIIVGVYHEGQQFFIGYGRTDLKGDKIPDEKTIFEIGSLTKVFTTLALARKVTEYGVALENPIKILLPPDVKIPQYGPREITLLDLATHYSGLPRMPENYKPADPMDPYKDYTRQRLYEFLAAYALPRPPGAAYEYSNLGSGLLGHTLAVKFGKTYEDLILSELCRPLGLKDTTFVVSEGNRPRFAQGYGPDLDRVPHWQFDVLAPAGALRSTATDVLKFAVANMKGTGSLGAAMNMTHIPRSPAATLDMQTGLGWLIIPKQSYNIIWHNGGTYGFSSFFSFSKEKETAVVVLRNTAAYMNGHTDQVGVSIMKCLLGLPYDTLKLEREVPVNPSVLDSYAGQYEQLGKKSTQALSVKQKLSRRGNRMIMASSPDEETIIYPESETVFFAKGVPAKVRFAREQNGEVTRMFLLTGGEETSWIKKQHQ